MASSTLKVLLDHQNNSVFCEEWNNKNEVSDSFLNCVICLQKIHKTTEEPLKLNNKQGLNQVLPKDLPITTIALDSLRFSSFKMIKILC
jgi:hypothetical protein